MIQAPERTQVEHLSDAFMGGHPSHIHNTLFSTQLANGPYRQLLHYTKLAKVKHLIGPILK